MGTNVLHGYPFIKIIGVGSLSTRVKVVWALLHSMGIPSVKKKLMYSMAIPEKVQIGGGRGVRVPGSN